MLGGLLFSLARIFEIVTLIPIIGMLAWFVDGFNDNNQLTPSFILVLFIVSVLACAWAVATLLRLGSTRRSAMFVAFIDLCFVGAFIAADYELRGIGNVNCNNFSSGSIYINLGPFGYYGRNSVHVAAECYSKILDCLELTERNSLGDSSIKRTTGLQTLDRGGSGTSTEFSSELSFVVELDELES
ncbi:uncharacterized protein PV06_06181 [Exophiala oligosperma]|uniref:Uncharacterized protein n=1 Tax=Exophiala oligosperma TaxID=215243 RepID=A0A0D2DI17_9EURO|nr:uncharacterized protein PV06_06181 [Exophiala oligosperma]KIW42653.1 hypothetical protein PV06_06181 [Exophiala oligosperma]